ncbi:hypothetical protein ACFFRR_003117 [Megaselia abdita]
MSSSEILDAIAGIKISLREEIKAHFGNVSCNILETEERLNANIAAIEKRMVQRVDESICKISERCEALEEKVRLSLSESGSKLEKIVSLIEENLSKTNHRCNVLDEEVKFLQIESEAKSQRIASLQIKLNQRNILLFNFEETERTESQLLELVVLFFEKNGKISVQPKDLEYVYRIGRKEEGKERPVMIAFSTTKIKNEILKARGNMNSSKVVIAEDFPSTSDTSKTSTRTTTKTTIKKAPLKTKKI